MRKLSRLFVLSGFLSASWAATFRPNKLSVIVGDVEFARGVSDCIKIGAESMFKPSNDLTIIASKSSRESHDIFDDTFRQTFADRNVEIFTDFAIAASAKSTARSRDSSFVVIESASNLRRLMSESTIERRAEYIVVSRATLEWFAKFANYLRKHDFTNVAFVVVQIGERQSRLVRPMENETSPDSPPILHILDVCNGNADSSASISRNNEHRVDVVYRFSSWLLYPSNRTLSYARILEGTEDPQEFAETNDGELTNFGTEVLKIFTDRRKIRLVNYEWPNQTEPTWIDAMNRCLNEEFDFFYAILPPPLQSRDLEAVVWYKHEMLIFVAPLEDPVISLGNILVPYQSTVWFCTLGLFGSFGLFAYAIERLWKRGLTRERITILGVCSVFVEQSLPSLPKKFGLRFVFGIWILYNLMKNAGYAAVFSSSLTRTRDGFYLKTFRDIYESGKTVCGSGTAKKLLNDTKDPVIRGIHDRFEEMPPMRVLDAVLNGICIGTRHLSIIEKHNMMTRSNESLRLYIPSEATIIEYPSFYFSTKRNPYNEEFKKTIYRAHEVGLVNWVKQKYTAKLDKTSRKIPISSDSGFLRLKHLRILFGTLCVGHFIAFLVFVSEICAHSRYARIFTETRS